MTECMQDYGCNSVCGDDDLPTKRARNDVYSCTSQPSLLKAVGVCSSVALPRARAWTREKTIAQVGPCNSVPHPTKGTLPNNPQNLAACFVPYRKSTLFFVPYQKYTQNLLQSTRKFEPFQSDHERWDLPLTITIRNDV